MASPAYRMDVDERADSGSPFVCAPDSPLRDVQRTCAQVAVRDATVLLTGETGTGKEIAARFIHAASARARRPFVPVNCAAIPENLLESELFGQHRGGFPGALAGRKGRVAMAEGGTLFLDEIGELSLPLQAKLLRLLQERSYEPVGGPETVAADFRLIAATHRDLAQEVREGRFRADLYFRLYVCPIRLPALRERADDVPVLFGYFWDRRPDRRPVDAGVMDRLRGYSWPGNVRELENLVERLSACSEGATVTAQDLPSDFGDFSALEPAASSRVGARPETPHGGDGGESDVHALLTAEDRAVLEFPGRAGRLPPLPVGGAAPSAERPGSFDVRLPIDLPAMLRTLENAYIDSALLETGNNKKEAAKLLGMGRTTLVEKLRRRR